MPLGADGRRSGGRTPRVLARLRERLADREPFEQVSRFARQRQRRKQAALGEIPERPENAVRLLTLNMAHGRRRVPHQALVTNQRVRRNLDELATLIDRVGAELVALQEADGPSAWSGNFDHVATLAASSKLDDHFRGEHNPFRLGRHNLASGTALMAQWPLDETRSVRFGSSWRCTKGFVVARVTVPRWNDTAIDVVSVHLDFLLPELRRRQIRAMTEVLSARAEDRPMILLGDLNCCWRQEPESIELLTSNLGLHAFERDGSRPTYPAYRPRRRFDWILISEHLRFLGHRRLPLKVSDHLGVLADIGLA